MHMSSFREIPNNRRSSLSVFDPEVMEGSGGVAVRDRVALVDGLGLGETASARAPLLAEILRLSKVWRILVSDRALLFLFLKFPLEHSLIILL